MGDAAGQLQLSVKHGTATVDVAVPALATVADLQQLLEAQTGLLARKQKLIFKGKVLAGTAKLADCGVASGAKLMLLTAAGAAGGVATQGQAAAQQLKQQKQDEAAARVKQLMSQARGGGTATASSSSPAAASSSGRAAATAIDWQERRRVWGKTGIIGLRDLGLVQLPEEALLGLEAARVADLSLNTLTCLPSSVGALSGLHTLRLGSNQLAELPFLAALAGGLRVLSLEANRLASLPPELGCLCSLVQLNCSGNRLAELPAQLSALTQLELLLADDNRLAALPEELGLCCSLLELSVERNQVAQLPSQFSRLQKLQALKADGNRVREVPPCILQSCASLAVLSLQDNPITADQLRSTPGFAEYDARRVAKCNKQLDFSLLAQAGRTFTEGASQQEWSRWATQPPQPDKDKQHDKGREGFS